MAKKINMITAGRAFYIQLDGNPIIDGTTNKDGSPLLVPQGSLAYDGNNTYLKMSDADLDWLLLGSAWNFVSDPLLLNPSTYTDPKYFGTSSGDSDIKLYRNGSNIFDIIENGIRFQNGHSILSAGNIDIEAGPQLILNSGQEIEMRSELFQFVYSRIEKMVLYGNRFVGLGSEENIGVYNLGPNLSLQVSTIPRLTSRVKKSKVRIIFDADNDVSAIVDRDYHVDQTGAVINYQDSFYSLSPNAIAIGLTFSVVFGNDIIATAESTLDMINPNMTITLDEDAIVKF